MTWNKFEKLGWNEEYGGYVEVIDETEDGWTSIKLQIQNGPRKEVGSNGADIEVLGELWLDILKSFNEGKYRCRENSITITKIEEALMWQDKRRKNRLNREVEGTSEE
jgi:hypothetical protein